MNGRLYIGFKGKNNASCILAKAISADSCLLTNSFAGLKRDIEEISCSYDSVILFGIDNHLTDTVRLEKVAEIDTAEFSMMNLEEISSQLEAAGISNYLSDKPTQYLCNAAYWYLLRKFDRQVVLIHIPSIKNLNEHFIDGMKQVFR